MKEECAKRLTEREKKNNEYLRENGAECVVLLQSDGSFPLKEPCKVALYGNGARDTIKGGTGSGEVNSRFVVSVEEGLGQAGFTITTKDWLEQYKVKREKAQELFYRRIKRGIWKNPVAAITQAMGAIVPEPEYDIPLSGEGDVAIYVLSRISGEGSDRDYVPGDILLSETEIRDILACQKKYQKFLLVLNVGGPVDLTPVREVPNILLLSQLGAMTGHILADILLGKSNPSGKLTTTWSRQEDYPLVGDFGDINDTNYREGIYVGYRYFDSESKRAIFPFGFGLSFTTFEHSGAEIRTEYADATVRVFTSVKVTNTGSFAGKEAVQVYVSVPEGKLDQPFQMLAGFVKTGLLLPGESETVEVPFDLKDLASYDSGRAVYLLESGKYIVRVGASSVDTSVAGVLLLEQDVITKKVRNVLGDSGFADWKPEKKRECICPETITPLTIDAKVIKAETVYYDLPQAIDPSVIPMTDRELALLQMGDFDPNGGIASVIGEASKDVAGAAGQTTTNVENVASLVMADGPAGVRLSKQFFYDKKGHAHSLGVTMPESIWILIPKPLRLLLTAFDEKPDSETDILEQYATAIPIGTAIAQSFSPDFAQELGSMVGEEMTAFGVHLWLAPALNIHRDIRCGRNFEYYSEDPLVSGLFTAAITRGVQQGHPGCGVTIKHFAANNQETNRYNSNSNVSERAMRDIYLKGFEIAVRESAPMAVMTSYNLLNGTHTSEHRGLIEDILRSEFGFDGIVMTDWVVNGGTVNKQSVHPRPYPSKVAAAGGDLFMPGSGDDFKELYVGLESGVVSREQAMINASRVLAMIGRLKK